MISRGSRSRRHGLPRRPPGLRGAHRGLPGRRRRLLWGPVRMNSWDVEPLWQTLDQLVAVHQVRAEDTLAVALRESARLPRLAGHDFTGLDRLKSLRAQGIVGVISR